MKKQPVVYAGDMSDEELKEWMQKTSRHLGGIDFSLVSELARFEENTLPQLKSLRILLDQRIDGLTSSLIHRTEDRARKNQEQAVFLGRVVQAADDFLSALQEMQTAFDDNPDQVRRMRNHQHQESLK